MILTTYFGKIALLRKSKAKNKRIPSQLNFNGKKTAKCGSRLWVAPVELNRTPASLCFDQDTARGPTLSPKTSPCLEGPHVGGVEHLKCRHFLPQVQGTSSDSWESDGRTRNDFTLHAAHTRVFECTRRDLHVKLTFHVCPYSAVILSAG